MTLNHEAYENQNKNSSSEMQTHALKITSNQWEVVLREYLGMEYDNI